MSYKVESRGKKMHMNKNIARLAVTAGLTAALSFGGVMAPVTMAFADGTPVATTNGNVTIKDEDYAGTTFKGIKIFSATVTQDQTGADVWDSTDEKTLSDIKWASDVVKDAVMSVFDGDGYVNKPTNDDAQAWAEFIKEQAGSDNVGVGAKVNADNKLNVIAEKLINTKGLEWTDLTNQQTENLGAGYWLFVTNQPGSTKDTNKTNGNDDAFTSPIFTIVGGSDVNVTPKKDVPNVTKAVKDDKNGKFVTDDSKNVFTAANKAADSAAGQLVEYQLAGTVASNINTYVKYSYAFTDNLPSTMVPNLDGNKPVVEVKINDSVVNPACYSATYVPGESTNTLTVSFENLKEAKDMAGNPITVDGSSTVYVNYEAKLVAGKINADMLGKAQVNNVKLTYSNNPYNTSGTGTTVDHPAYDYTYGIDVTKVGSDKDETGNLKKLQGVQFTLKEEGSNEFIKADGTTTTDTDAAILTTNDKGMINVVGLDEGTYILKEVTPAPGYNNSASNGVKFTIARGTLKQDGSEVIPDKNSAHVTAADGVVKADSAVTSIGKLSFIIVDQKGSNLPLTGLNGVTFTWIAGGAVLCIGVAHLIRSRKQAEESEQE